MQKTFKRRDNYRGFVYIASNPLINGLKIGYTTKSVSARLHELSSETGSPAAYKEEYSVLTRRCQYLEELIHSMLAEKRIKNAREFFDVSIKEACDTLNLAFRKVEEEIDSNPKLKFIFECISKLDDMKNRAAGNGNWDEFKRIKTDLKYLYHTGYGIDAKYKKALEIEKKNKTLKGF